MNQLLRRLVTGDHAAITAIVEASHTTDDPLILVAASLFTQQGASLLVRAEMLASTTRERQVVAIAAAHHRGDRELVDALARDHLVDHPDNVLVAWIADASYRQSPSKDGRVHKEL
jgi:hypothetical protein